MGREDSGAMLVLLRQLHYLIQAFQHVEGAEQAVGRVLAAAHGGDAAAGRRGF
jgi:hypothetical protein